ncbi:MAG: hypothetical protein AABW86_03190 [Candidatus Micrarchaeota archaeon]
MRLRSKALLAVSAVAFIRCSAPLIESAHPEPTEKVGSSYSEPNRIEDGKRNQDLVGSEHAQERPAVTAPVLPAQPSEKQKEEPAKPKPQDSRPADCPSVVYEPDERCGLERREWKGGPISEEELNEGERILFIKKEFRDCLGRWAKEEQRRTETYDRTGKWPRKSGITCKTESKKIPKTHRALMKCGPDEHTNAFQLTTDGAEIAIIDGNDIFIKWDNTPATLVIVIKNEKTNEETTYLFRLVNQPRYAVIPNGDGKTSDLVVWSGGKQIRINLDVSCTPVYSEYPDIK